MRQQFNRPDPREDEHTTAANSDREDHAAANLARREFAAKSIPASRDKLPEVTLQPRMQIIPAPQPARRTRKPKPAAAPEPATALDELRAQYAAMGRSRGHEVTEDLTIAIGKLLCHHTLATVLDAAWAANKHIHQWTGDHA